MENIRKGHVYIFTGLLIGTFTQAVNVNDEWGMYKIVMYFLSSALVIVGYIRVLLSEKTKKFIKSAYIFIFLVIYSVGISVLYIKFGGVVSSLISMFFIGIMSRKICIKNK